MGRCNRNASKINWVARSHLKSPKSLSSILLLISINKNGIEKSICSAYVSYSVADICLACPGHRVPPAPGGAAAAQAVDEGGAAVVQTAAGQAEAGQQREQQEQQGEGGKQPHPPHQPALAVQN